MKEECGSFMAALSVKVVTVNMLLSVFFLPGVLADCGDKTAGLSITAPKKMEALSGSCLLIPCSFSSRSGHTFDNKGTIYGVWMKKNLTSANFIFNSSKPDNVYDMKIIGNLRQKNCTTLFCTLKPSQSDRYFFRIENGPFRATACNDSLQITVKDSPQSPRIEISGDVKDLKEKESVTITCSAFTPCPHSPPELTWNLQQDSHRHTEENTDGTFTTKIQQDITLSDTHDGYTITCSASYPVIGGNRVNTSEETLSVSYAPKDTSASISPSGLVSAGSWVNLSCSSRAKPPVSFTWFRISSEGDVNVSEGQVYTLNMTNMADRESYFCVAANILGNETSQWIHLKKEASRRISLISTSVIAVFAVSFLIGLVLCVCYFQSKRSTSQQTHSGTQGELDYEEMDHFKRRAEPSSTSVQDSRQQQEIVSFFQPENSSTLKADVLKDHSIQSQTVLPPADKTQEELDYEEMTLFMQRDELSSVSVQNRRQQLEGRTEESTPENSLTQTNSLDHVYASVKKKLYQM